MNLTNLLMLVALAAAPVQEKKPESVSSTAPKTARKPATFRVRMPTCAPCDLKDWVDKTAARDGLDCGESSQQGFACARKAAVEKKPFRFVYELQGIDSKILRAFVQTGQERFELQYDSSINGGNMCAATVHRRKCAAIAPVGAEDGPNSLGCVDPGPLQELCSQESSRKEALDPPRDVALLRCSRHEEEYVLCGIGKADDPLAADMVMPAATGPNLICEPYTPTLLWTCRPE